MYRRCTKLDEYLRKCPESRISKDSGINYEPFWQTIDKKRISQYKLLQLGVNNNTLHRLRTGLPITTETVSLLCRLLDCQPNEIMEFIPEDHKGDRRDAGLRR